MDENNEHQEADEQVVEAEHVESAAAVSPRHRLRTPLAAGLAAGLLGAGVGAGAMAVFASDDSHGDRGRHEEAFDRFGDHDQRGPDQQGQQGRDQQGPGQQGQQGQQQQGQQQNGQNGGFMPPQQGGPTQGRSGGS